MSLPAGYIEISPVTPCRAYEVYHNTRVQKYADGGVKVSFATSPIYKDKDFVSCDRVANQRLESISTFDESQLDIETQEERYLARKYKSRCDSLKRSRESVFNIVRMNSWDFFFTGTLSPDCGIDRYNADSVSSAVNKFMYTLVRSGKVIRYIFCPEEHEDGAIHYHGFVKLGKGFKCVVARNPKTGRYITRGKGVNKKYVYNWLDWHFGFTTLMKAYGSRSNQAKYMTKYITKSADCPMKHRYYAAGDVVRQVPVDLFDVPFEDVPLQVVHTDFGNFKYISFDDYNSFLDFLQAIFTHSMIRQCS